MITHEEIGTRYGGVAIRFLVNPKDPEDMKQVHALQDAIKVEQKDSGKFEVLNFDRIREKKVRDALIVLGTTIPDTRRMFGMPSEIDPVRHLIGTAILWGGLPEKDGIYLNITPDIDDGAAVYKLNIQEVPVDGLLSITVYNAKGYLEANQYNAYSVNNITARKSADRSVVVQFGRLRRQDSELPADYAGLEFHGATLSAARGSLERHMEISGGAARELTLVSTCG